jgi:aspartate ammonia-lyase
MGRKRLYRIESDSLGSRKVPADAYYGIHTLRAMENFPITGEALSSVPELIEALAVIKLSSAAANYECGLLESRQHKAIARACAEILNGALHEQFTVDLIQGGAGTSTNMNANEVIANRALELLGHDKGQYQHLHPIGHVNASQSTNDVYPSALKLAIRRKCGQLLEQMMALQAAVDRKSKEFHGIVKVARTQLQDAVPMTLEQEFGVFAQTLANDIEFLKAQIRLLEEINLGGTAIGTGLNTPRGYRRLVLRHLKANTGLSFHTAKNLLEATQSVSAFVTVSGALKRVALNLSKLCNDLRLLSSGPAAGLREIRLPERQAGSSIMPGKVNPVIPEVVNQVAFRVIGNDSVVSHAAEGGQLQLNPFVPVIGYSIFQSITLLSKAARLLEQKCVVKIEPDRARIKMLLESSAVVAAALNPSIGYDNAALIAKQSMQTGRSVRELVLASGLLTPEALEKALRPEAMIGSL